MQQTSVSMMIKPVSAACDLGCDYCLYCDASLHRETDVHPLMSKAVVDQHIGKSLSSYQAITYIFQGGKPTLAGLPFFQYFVDKVKQERQSGSEVHYALQTNGMHLDQEWVAFNILTVITEDLAHTAKSVYSYLLQRNFLHASSHGLFLKELFDLWYESLLQGVAVHIRFFENLVMMLGGKVLFQTLYGYLLGSVMSEDFPASPKQSCFGAYREPD